MNSPVAPTGPNDQHVARTALMVILIGLAANLGFNALQTIAGADFPYTSFLFDPADRFGDFFKLLGWFDRGPLARSEVIGFLADIPEMFRVEATRLRTSASLFNPMHLPPLPMATALLMRDLLGVVDPGLVFAFAMAAIVAATGVTVWQNAPSHRLAWVIAIVASYPFLLTLDRGHLFAPITCLCLIAGTMRSIHGRVDWLTILLFAVALNFRPNAAIIPGALLLCGIGWRWRQSVALAATTLAIAACCYVVAHALFPAYTPAAISRGLSDYAVHYVAGTAGIGYGSSWLGGLKMIFGTLSFLPNIPLLIGFLFAAATIVGRWTGYLGMSEFIFLLVSGYILVSQVTADYHLLVMVVPLLALATEGRNRDITYWTILLTSLAVLIPKNYAFVVQPQMFWSWQVVLNPLILTVGASIILIRAWTAGGSSVEMVERPLSTPASPR